MLKTKIFFKFAFMKVREFYNFEYEIPSICDLLDIGDFCKLSAIKQSKKWHKEMDVLTHSISVMKEMKCYILEEEKKRIFLENEVMILLLSAVLHDIGKVRTTLFSLEKRDWTSKNHDIIGSEMIKDMFSDDDIDLVETIAWFVKYHMKPLYWSEEYSNIDFKTEVKKCYEDSLKCGKYKNIANFNNLITLKIMDNKGAIFTEYDNWKEKLDFIKMQIKELGYE